ncbi:MAG: tetratricopeptide repeat protein [Acidobacteriia bacterium]|nr:tetratricopeptide repeat protein [Terriglobia bacterium]
MNAARLLRVSLLALLSGAASAHAQTPAPRKPRPAATQKLRNPLNDLLDEAQRAIERQDFPAALAPLQNVVAQQPDFAYGHFQLAYVFTALQRWDDARAEYQRAAALDPKLAEAHLNLGLLLLDRDPAAAVVPLRKAVELLPAQSRPRFLLGLALERTNDLSGAREALEGAAKLDPRDFETHLALARVLLRANQFAPAEANFREALALQPDSAPARLGLAQALDAQQKPEAVEAYRGYLQLQPADRAARARVLRFLFEQKEYDAALAELDRMDAAQPPDVLLLRLRADILIAQSRWDDAIATLQRAIALAPEQRDLRAGLGRLYLQKRDFPSAERELLAVLRADASDLTAWKDLSSAYYLQGDCPAALTALDELARRQDLNSGAWFVRATCYDKLRKMPQAIEAYQKFLSLDKGQNSNQDWQAQQRIAVLRHMLENKR